MGHVELRLPSGAAPLVVVPEWPQLQTEAGSHHPWQVTDRALEGGEITKRES